MITHVISHYAISFILLLLPVGEMYSWQFNFWMLQSLLL